MTKLSGKDGAKTPFLGDWGETTALLEHDDELYSLLCTQKVHEELASIGRDWFKRGKSNLKPS